MRVRPTTERGWGYSDRDTRDRAGTRLDVVADYGTYTASRERVRPVCPIISSKYTAIVPAYLTQACSLQHDRVCFANGPPPSLLCRTCGTRSFGRGRHHPPPRGAQVQAAKDRHALSVGFTPG
jgi:hypothetical protein